MSEGKETLDMVQLGHIQTPVPARGVPNHHLAPLADPPLPRLDVPQHTPDAHTRLSKGRLASCTCPMHMGSRSTRATSTIMPGRAGDNGPLSSHKALFTAGRTRRAGGHPAALSVLFLRRAHQTNCISSTDHLHCHQVSSRGRWHRHFGSGSTP
jgi:hypothetical protein